MKDFLNRRFKQGCLFKIAWWSKTFHLYTVKIKKKINLFFSTKVSNSWYRETRITRIAWHCFRKDTSTSTIITSGNCIVFCTKAVNILIDIFLITSSQLSELHCKLQGEWYDENIIPWFSKIFLCYMMRSMIPRLALKPPAKQ